MIWHECASPFPASQRPTLPERNIGAQRLVIEEGWMCPTIRLNTVECAVTGGAGGPWGRTMSLAVVA